MKKSIFGLVVLLVVVVIIVSFKGKSLEGKASGTSYEILKKWELPDVLDEVSGIAWAGEDRVACVQDEDGTIFIYNLKTSKVENEISFGSGGDYEGVAIVENSAYVLRSDGIIFEISDFMGAEPQVQKHVTQTNQLPGINIEGLCADPANNRLLLAVKERRNAKKQKEIYAVDLSSKNSAKEPLFRIDFSDPIFQNVKEKEKFMPGEIGVHPQTGELYILDGTRPKILITRKDGKSKELYVLQLEDFGNPEGLTFNSKGELYISNEAEDAPANILKVALNRNN